jgi:uncharacterized membrane protein
MTVTRSSQVLAFLAYAFLIVGSFIVLLIARKNQYASYHARQSLAISLAAITAPLVWLVIGWLLAWIPWFGGVMAFASFSLVIMVYIMVIYAWITGLINSASAKVKPVPFFGEWAQRLPV